MITTGKFTQRVLLIAALLMLIAATPVWFLLTHVASLAICGAILLSALSSIAAFIIVLRGIEKRIQAFLSYVVGGMMAKMFVGIITITAVVLLWEPLGVAYVLSYFGSYLVFTTFEVYALMRNLRPQFKKGSESNA